MTIAIRHKLTSAVADAAATGFVKPSNWNDTHDISLAAGSLLGNSASIPGPAQELTLNRDEFVLTGTSISLKEVALAPGTYTNTTLTVDAKGRVIAIQNGPAGGGFIVPGGDPELEAIAALVSAADTLPYFTGSGTAALAPFTAFGRSLVDDASSDAARSTLGVVIGTDVQAFDAELSAIAGLTSAADSVPYFTGSGTAALMTVTPAARTVLDDTSTASMLATLGGQPLDSELTAIAGLASAADQLPYFTGAGTASLATLTTFGRSLVDDADDAAARTTLGVGAVGTQGDGDKGDITVSSTGATWTIDNDAVTYAKIQNVSSADRLLGRGNGGGSGDVQEISLGTGLALSGTTLGLNLAPAITLGTPVASTSGTSIDFTGLPSTLKRITIMFDGVSTNGTSIPMIQLGKSGGIETTGYLSGGINYAAGAGGQSANSTAGILLAGSNGAVVVMNGTITLYLLSSSANTWAASCVIGRSDAAAVYASGGTKSLAGVLDRVRITTVNGTDTFDAGTINIQYE